MSTGDVNYDGYADLLTGTPFFNWETGRAYVFPGSATGLSSGSVSGAATVIDGEELIDYSMARALSSADYNGDGYTNLFISSSHLWAQDGGRMY